MQANSTGPSPADAANSKHGPLSPLDLALILMALASLMLVAWNLQKTSLRNANTGSRFATVEALVDHGTYYIDRTHYVNGTVDKVRLHGRFLSSKPPMLPTYAAGVYWLHQKITGQTIGAHEHSVVQVVTLASGWLSHLIVLLYFVRLAKLLLRKELAIIASVGAVAFAYLGVGYATTLNNHSIAAALAVAGVYYGFRIGRGDDVRTRHWIMAGLILGFLPGIDVPSTLVTGCIGLYLLVHDRKKALLLFTPALIPGIAAHLTLTYIASEGFVPVYARRELYDYPGSYWLREKGIDALREPKHIYLFNLLFGHHGLFSMTPLFLFSAYELGRVIRHRTALLREALVVIGIIVGFIGFYVLQSHNYGGWCVGMRWLIPGMPLLMLFFGVWLDRVKLGLPAWSLVLVAFAISQFNTLDALSGPFQYSKWHNWLDGRPGRARTYENGDLVDAVERSIAIERKNHAPRKKRR